MSRRAELLSEATSYLERASEDALGSDFWIGEAIRCLEQAARSQDDDERDNDGRKSRLM